MRPDAGTTTVTSPGTAVQLNDSEDKVKVIEVRARPDNKGKMYFGVSDVSSTNGRTLQPGETQKVDFGKGSKQFNVFYVDAANGGDKLDWIAILR